MAEINNAFKVKKGLDVTGDSSLHGNLSVDGYATVPNLPDNENSTKVVNAAFVKTAITNLINGSPGALDTLNELAQALGDDPNFATTMTNALALKAPLASPALTGVPTAPTASPGTNSTQLSTTAYADAIAALKANIASPSLTGTPLAPTAVVGTNTTQISTTAFVYAVLAAYGVGSSGSAIPGGSTGSIDQNTIPSGIYQVTSNNTGTKPTGLVSGFLIVMQGSGSTVAHQMYYDDSTARIFSRAYASAAWTTWREAAYLDSPAFSGTPTAPTAAPDTNTTQIATAAFVLAQAGAAVPLINGAATVGTSLRYSRQDHIHPTDTTRAPVNNAALTGVPTAPTAAAGTNSTQIATTAYADAIAALKANISNPAFIGNVTVTGGLGSDDFAFIAFPDNGNYNSTAASVIGAIKIKLPVAYTTSQLGFDLTVNEAVTDSAFKLRINGMNRGSDSSWQFVTANTAGGVASRIPNVRFGNDGTTCCIWVGEITDTWTTPQVQISNLVVGNSGVSNSWLSGWAVSYVTTFDTVKTGPVTPSKAASLNSPAFTGVPTVPTPSASDNSSTVPNTSWVNAAIAASGSTSIVSIPVTATAMTLTAAQYANSMIIFTGTLTGNTTITVPNTAHAFIAANNTSGSYTLTIKSSGQTPSVQVVQNKANSLYCDTTGVYATSSTTGVQFAKQTNLAVDTTLDLSYLGSIIFVTASGKTITLPLSSTYPAGAGVAVFNASSGNINVATSGSDTFDAIASPLVLYPNDCYFLESSNGTSWHTVWYSNEKSPKFKTSVSAPVALFGGATDNGVDKLQVTGSASLSGDLNLTNATNNTVGNFSTATYSGGLQIESYNIGNTTKKNIAIAVASASRVLIGTTTDNGTDKLQVNGTVKSLTGGFVFPDGTTQTTANGVTAPISTVVTPANGVTSITTTGYNVGFVQLFKNNGRMIPGVDFTATDGVNIVLTTAATGRDRYEYLTAVIYSPSTVFQPTSYSTNLAVGASVITTNYNVGCVWVFKNSLKLLPSAFTATNGTTITLAVASSSTSDVYEVVTFTPFAVNGMLPLSGGTMTGALNVSGGAGTKRSVYLQTNNSNRWEINAASVAESGSNAGSNLNLSRYDDTGTLIDSPVSINRSTGLLVLSKGLTLPDGNTIVNTPIARNRFINGAMEIDQRNSGASQTFTAGTYAYSVDRWYVYSTGANVTGQQVAGSGQSRNRYQITGAASVTGIQFGQRIETANSYDLNNSNVTLSVDLANSLLTTVTWTAYYANTADTFGTPSSPTRTQIATGTFTVNSTINRYSTIIAIPAAATTGIEVVFSVGAQTSGTWSIGNVQLEMGTSATPFERRSYGYELLLCQRYYENFSQLTYYGYGNSGNVLGYTFEFKVQKRVAPTATVGSFSVSGCTASILGSGVDYTQINASLTATGVFTFSTSTLKLSAEL